MFKKQRSIQNPSEHLRWSFFVDILKGIYPHDFERALKSMTCVQIGSIHTDGLKNVKKIKMVPRCHGNQPKCPKRGEKCLHAGQNISS